MPTSERETLLFAHWYRVKFRRAYSRDLPPKLGTLTGSLRETMEIFHGSETPSLVSISRVRCSRSATESEARHQRQQAKQPGQGQRARGSRQILTRRGFTRSRSGCCSAVAPVAARAEQVARRLGRSRAAGGVLPPRSDPPAPTERRDVHLGDLQTPASADRPRAPPAVPRKDLRPFQRAADLDTALFDVLARGPFRGSPLSSYASPVPLAAEHVAGAAPAPPFLAWISTNSFTAAEAGVSRTALPGVRRLPILALPHHATDESHRSLGLAGLRRRLLSGLRDGLAGCGDCANAAIDTTNTAAALAIETCCVFMDGSFRRPEAAMRRPRAMS